MFDNTHESPVNVRAIHHLEFHVNNALQCAFWYCCNFGFQRFAVRRQLTTSEIAVRNGDVILVFKCSLTPEHAQINAAELARHGDFIKDVAFQVDDLHGLMQKIHEMSPEIIILPPTIPVENEGITIAQVHGVDNASVVHTLIQKSSDYDGVFLPGFTSVDDFVINDILPKTTLHEVDHVVEGHAEGSTGNVLAWYERVLAMHRFWSIDERSVFTKYSALRATVVANSYTHATPPRVQVVVAEPVRLERDFRGQIQEFLDYNGGHGVQHVAFTVTDICAQVAILRTRGVQFLDIPNSYYDELEERLAKSSIHVVEDLKKVRELKLLLDFDDSGYLLQIFTKPMQDRPTFFVEIIQRHNFNVTQGFGAGNFKALFAAVEREQRRKDAENRPANLS